MGIKDLLRFMKPHVEPIHISKYAGKRVGIDAYSWLHKGAYSCSMELCLNSEGEKKFQYLNYFMHRINLLHHHKITPVVVFDGQNIPCKAATEHERSSRRKTNLDLAMAKLKEGNANAATELFQRAVSISPSMAHPLIQILRSEDIEFVVAPYEADAQLAYLCSLEAERGGIQGVISEDSDLLTYGCPSIMFKMDRFGNGEEIVLSKVFESLDKVPSFRNLNMELFTGMCVLAGCDFLPSVPGIGIAKAYNLVLKYRNLDRVLSVLKFEKGKVIPEDYSTSFKEALAVFQHARVYDANSKSLMHITPPSEKLLQSLGDLDFLGPDIPQSMAIAIAEGNLDPSTMQAFDHFSSSINHIKSSIIKQASTRLQRVEATTIASEESCLTVISSQRVKTERTKMIKQKPLKVETQSSNEVAELDKLVCSFNTPPPKGNTTFAEEVMLKIPENNPFKKRKLEEVQLNQIEIITEQVSVLTEVENSEVLCETPESQKSVNSKPIIETKKAKKEKPIVSKHQNKENKKGSILNFFCRV